MKLREVEIRIPSKNVFTEGDMREVPSKTIIGGFHCWEHYKNEDYAGTKAIVETEDGKVHKFDTHEIKFTGRPFGAAMFEDGLEAE
ncbi:hypothetical protein [Flavobacterium sp.]|uniref:hypothetical protein n=1 Tax=Flavobacterium sp. TaxID=239 RepID=UPI003A94E6CC